MTEKIIVVGRVCLVTMLGDKCVFFLYLLCCSPKEESYFSLKNDTVSSYNIKYVYTVFIYNKFI